MLNDEEILAFKRLEVAVFGNLNMDVIKQDYGKKIASSWAKGIYAATFKDGLSIVCEGHTKATHRMTYEGDDGYRGFGHPEFELACTTKYNYYLILNGRHLTDEVEIRNELRKAAKATFGRLAGESKDGITYEIVCDASAPSEWASMEPDARAAYVDANAQPTTDRMIDYFLK